MPAMRNREALGLCIGLAILVAIAVFLPPVTALFVCLSFIAAGPCFRNSRRVDLRKPLSP